MEARKLGQYMHVRGVVLFVGESGRQPFEVKLCGTVCSVQFALVIIVRGHQPFWKVATRKVNVIQHFYCRLCLGYIV